MQAEMGKVPWYRAGWTVLIAALVFPPLGLVLLWIRPWRGWKSAVLRPLATLGIVIVAFVHLFQFYGLRAEMDGTGMWPILTFRSPQREAEQLEKQRAAQKALAPPLAPALVVTKAEENKKISAEVAEAHRAHGDTAKELKADAPETTAASRVVHAYWTDFRGPNRDGIYAEQPVLASWPAGGLKPLWKQPVGGGYASFVVADGRAFTIEQRRTNEVVAAYDVQTGRELWTNSWKAFFQESMGGDGPRATPTWHDGRLYALGAQGELRCLDAKTGETIWRKNILADNGVDNLTWGMAASPLIVDGKVIVQPGGRGSSIVAYDAATGKTVWQSQSDKQAYTAPMIVTLAGQRQLLAVSAERAMGLTVEEGKLLWDFPWVTEYEVNAAQPIVADANHFFISAGYDHGAALVEVTRDADKFRSRAVWKNKEMKNRFSSSVLHEGAFYGFDEGILACIDAKTGQRRWKGGRYGHGQLLLAGANLIVITEEGELALVRATPEKFEELARFSAIDGKTWNVPAISGGILLVRNEREMAAFKISP